MTQEMWIVFHGGHGQIPFLDYLSRILLHLLAFAAVALVTHLVVGVVAAMTAEPAVELDTEQPEQ